MYINKLLPYLKDVLFVYFVQIIIFATKVIRGGSRLRGAQGSLRHEAQKSRRRKVGLRSWCELSLSLLAVFSTLALILCVKSSLS